MLSELVKNFQMNSKEKAAFKKFIDRFEEYIKSGNTKDVLDSNSNSDTKKALAGFIFGWNGIQKEANIELLIEYAKAKNFISKREASLARKLIKDYIIYIHDASSHKMFCPYCFAFSVKNLLIAGLPFGHLKSERPKNIISYTNQVLDMIWGMATEFAGAISPYDFLIYFGFFVEKDNPDEYIIENLLQHYIYSVNRSIRAEGDSAFTNINIYDKVGLKKVVYFEQEAKMLNTLYGSKVDPKKWFDAVLKVQEIYLKIFTKGDPITNLPFRFPVTTVQLSATKSGKFKDPYGIELAKNYMKDGRFYIFINYGNVDAFCNCCRLISDRKEKEELLKAMNKAHINSFGVANGQVGSHRVISINMVKIMQHKNWKRFLNRIIKVCFGLLKAHKQLLKELIEAGLIHFFRSSKNKSIETGAWFDLDTEFFSTIGIVGLYDAVEYWANDIKELLEAEKEILRYLKYLIKKYSIQFQLMGNLELVPAENASWAMAKAVGRNLPLSNQYLALWKDFDFITRLKFSGVLDHYCSGGTITFIPVLKELSPEETEKVLNIAARNKAIYFTLNPTYTICNSCNFITYGKYEKCPKCGGSVEHLTRIVGYFTPVSQWNQGKKLEFKQRIKDTLNTLEKEKNF